MRGRSTAHGSAGGLSMPNGLQSWLTHRQMHEPSLVFMPAMAD